MLQQITNRRQRYSFRLAIQYLSIMSKKISDGALRVQLRCFLDMEQIVVLRFRTVPGVPAPFHILNGLGNHSIVKVPAVS
jgi:hypothetical protein